MGRHRKEVKSKAVTVHAVVGLGLAVVMMAGFALAWVTLSAIGVGIMALSGGSLAIALR